MMVYTLACATCARGWSSTVPQGVCGRCGRTCLSRGHYQVVELVRR